MPMQRLVISLRDDQIDRLKAVSKQTGASVSEVIRRTLDGTMAAKTIGHGSEFVAAPGWLECAQCHKPYRAGRLGSQYCGATCRSNARHKRNREAALDDAKVPPKDGKCITCGLPR